MEKHIISKQTGIPYTLVGSYYLPFEDMSDDEEEYLIGIWGQRHLRYLSQHKKAAYIELLFSGSLNGYLHGIDKQAQTMFERLMKQFAENEGITEQIKAENQMEWVRRMNNVRNVATEIVNHDLIFN